MRLRQIQFVVSVAAFLISGASAVQGQTQDTSGNGLLKGTYKFRHLAVTSVDSNNDPAEIAASYGTITFDGNGNYTISGTTVDNTVSSGSPATLTATGTYAIGAGGMGYVSNPLHPTDYNTYIWGAVSQGVFAGSSTESALDPVLTPINDTFVAIPVGAALTNAGFTAAYQTGVLDFTGASASTLKNALFELTPNGKGGFGTIALNGQAANQTSATLVQNITGAAYNFNSDGSATLTIPLPSGVSAANALFTGSKTLFVSADGNFVLGWTAGGYDIFFGVKALSVTGTNALTTGLFFTTALENSPGALGGYGTDSYYGGINNSGNSNGDSIVHERLNYPTAFSFDFGTDDRITVNTSGTTPTDLNGYNYIFGNGGQAFVGTGSNGVFSLVIGLHAATFTGTGVYLNPIGVVNAASQQPVTASIAPGELLLLYGSGLSAGTVVTAGGQAFPTQLGNVTVTIDGYPCPIYYVTSGQLAVTVPYEVASNQTGLANIQVNNNGAKSNVVQVYLADAAPGAFSANANGVGFAAAVDDTSGQIISTSNPVQAGDVLSFYLSGLGTVTPTVTDGAVGPVPLSYSDVYNAGVLAVNFNDYTLGSTANAGTVSFAGLAPYEAGLYQVNVTVPTGVLGTGDDVYVEFITDAADVNQIQIPFGAGAPTPTLRTSGTVAAVATGKLKRDAAMRAHAKRHSAPRVARGAPVALR